MGRALGVVSFRGSSAVYLFFSRFLASCWSYIVCFTPYRPALVIARSCEGLREELLHRKGAGPILSFSPLPCLAITRTKTTDEHYTYLFATS